MPNTNTIIKIVIPGIIILILIFIFSSSLSAQPTNSITATRLAFHVAHQADCGNFEFLDYKQDYASFSCDKIVNTTDRTFEIRVFYKVGQRQQLEKELFNNFKTPFARTGKAFLIIEAQGVEMDRVTLSHSILEEDFADFPGELIKLQ